MYYKWISNMDEDQINFMSVFPVFYRNKCNMFVNGKLFSSWLTNLNWMLCCPVTLALCICNIDGIVKG